MLTIDVKSSLGRLPMMLHQKNENKTCSHETSDEYSLKCGTKLNV